MLKGRALLVGLLAVGGAYLVVRTAAVEAYADANPSRAASIWPGHPKVLVSQALTEIGIAAVKRQPPPTEALERIDQAGRASPLLHDPFLTRAIRARQAGNLRLAEAALVAARQRAPREAAPRYFLSQLYLTSGRARQGLAELATLARLLPHGAASVAPSLAAYARSSGDVANLKATFRSNPELEQAVLVELSKNPANADIAFRLANRFREADGSAPDWVKVMLPRIVEAGQADKAYGLWEGVSGVRSRGRLFDPTFTASKAPPPFNWVLRSDSAGFAEPDGKGGLHALFYGREDAVLATQTMLLLPGSYTLSLKVAGNSGGMLRWTIACVPGGREILTLGLGSAANSTPTGRFAVPEACRAQRIDLRGVAGELSKQADVSISGLTLARQE